MSYNPFRRLATESANQSSADGSPGGRNSQPNTVQHDQNSNSPIEFLDPEQPDDEPSPWSASSGGTAYNSLTLPPINPDNNFNELPSFNNSHYFDALPGIQSPNSFLPCRSTTAAATANTNSRPPSGTSQPNDRQLPPPSNQEQQRPQRPVSQYRLAGSESPDPFEDLDFIDLSPPPADILSHSTRQSSFVDLTESSPAAMAPSRKRKASTPGTGRAIKVVKSSSSNAKKEMSEVARIDLIDIDDKKEYDERMAKEQAEMIKKQNQEAATRSVKLAEFQCIICMDNPTDLTVTFCGHLFCSECLHQALHAGDKKCCPVCRSNIVARKAGEKQPKNGVFVLEMKFMTAKKKGKQAVR